MITERDGAKCRSMYSYRSKKNIQRHNALNLSFLCLIAMKTVIHKLGDIIIAYETIKTPHS